MENFIQNQICCPGCGNRDLQTVNETNMHTKGKGYSSSKGCLGYLMFGPLGLLCGSCGQGQKTTVTNTTYFVCNKCGEKFKRPEDMKKEIKELTMIINIVLPLIAIVGLI